MSALTSNGGLAQQSLEIRLKKSTLDLLELERSMMSGGIDPRVLREFRDAVDYVRKAAWAVQEWQERQSHQRDTSTVLPLLMLERIRRATQLCRSIADDVQSHSGIEGLAELSEAAGTLQRQLSGR